MNGDRLLVSTMLTGAERCRVDAVGMDAYEVVHRDSIDEVVGDVRARRARAVVLSVACYQPGNATRIEGRIASIVRDFPRVTTLALLTEASGLAPSAMLSLGRSGIRTVVDARRPEGWRMLRQVLAEHSDVASDIVSAAIAQLAVDLSDATADCRRFFVTLFSANETVTRVDQLGQIFAVLPSTLISRFVRRGLPSPKLYLSWARLVRAASLLEDPGISISAAATALEYSSPQAFTRHLQLQLGITVSAFRRDYKGPTMLRRFREELVLGYLPKLSGFRPIGGKRE
jgi:AraC-like DNA-binding protein